MPDCSLLAFLLGCWWPPFLVDLLVCGVFPPCWLNDKRQWLRPRPCCPGATFPCCHGSGLMPFLHWLTATARSPFLDTASSLLCNGALSGASLNLLSGDCLAKTSSRPQRWPFAVMVNALGGLLAFPPLSTASGCLNYCLSENGSEGLARL